MSKLFETLIAVLLIMMVAHAQLPKCPLQNALQLSQDTITVSSQGNVSLRQGADIQCYNYTLSTPFTCAPGVAIAVNNLESQYSPNLFFSIKAINSDNFGVIPFVVRTHWGYTSWTKITFSFLAETSSQIEAGYYQLDTGSLSSCNSGKSIVAFLPFINRNISGNTAITFLNGFEISSIAVNSSYLTPFQVQIVSNSVTSQGISIVLSSTSATQVHALFVSYIVYNPSIQNLVAGTYTYNQYAPTNSLTFSPPIGISNFNVGFHGFNGFIVRNTRSNLQLLGSLVNGNLTFTTSSTFYYLSYSYFYLIGGPCGQCTGYNINYNGACVAACPPNSYWNGATCVTCQGGQIWNGNQCVSRCANGQVWDSVNLICACPTGLYWNGNSCISCPTGQVWNIQLNQCACRSGQNWNGYVCIACTSGQIWDSNVMGCSCPSNTQWNGVNCIACPTGQVFNTASMSCGCSSGSNWNGFSCITCTNGQVWNSQTYACGCAIGYILFQGSCTLVPSCYGGQVLNSATNQCVCPNNANWNGYTCISCSNGQVWSSSLFGCSCPANTQWNGASCISCPSGQVFNAATLSCGCPSGLNWNGNSCIACSNGLVWNSLSMSCTCASGYIMFQGSCALVPSCSSGQILNTSTNQCVCASNANWNGYICITCSNGQVWSSNTLSCNCPQNLNWNGYSCISCPTGQIWNDQSNSCSCSSGQNWNGFSCVTCSGGRSWNSALNSCVCPSGLNWNGASCISCSGNSNWNGFSCITCSSGQVWNSVQNICQCPSGQQWNGTACITPCPAGMVNINGLCSCQAGFYQLNGVCTKQPSCSSGQTWDGTRCVAIQCPPGTSWNGTLCTSQSIVNCPAGTYYNGIQCVTNTTNCPTGTSWTGTICIANSTCPNGTYLSGSSCVPISQICPSGLTWQNNQCVVVTNCPTGTYVSGSQCIPLQPCANGKIWNSTVTQCVCPTATFWNGNICVTCTGGQVYQSNVGCACPNGTFYNGSTCNPVQVNQCASILNSIWSGSSCVCNNGFTIIGMQCICQGLAVSATYCNQCYNKPNSTWTNGVCQCNSGLSDVGGQCVVPAPPTTNIVPSCSVATFFEPQQLRCLPCASGCLSCSSCYSCTSCQPGFYLDFASSLCIEVCGDGKRFTLPCDDGNNINGDGCSSDCKIEVGSTCAGGSPNSKDTCSKTLPSALNLTATGQSHLQGTIVLNVQANYLPLALINSASDCSNQCGNILSVKIISGDTSSTGIIVAYIPTTSFSFSITINFGREPIGLFTVQIGINPNLVQKYFSGIDVSKNISVNVNPAFLAIVGEDPDQIN